MYSKLFLAIFITNISFFHVYIFGRNIIEKNQNTLVAATGINMSINKANDNLCIGVLHSLGKWDGTP